MDKFSYLGTSDIATIEALYQQYLENPESVEESWRAFFSGFEFAQTNFDTSKTKSEGNQHTSKEFNAINLINAYRQRGHLFTETNPVRTRRKYYPTLDIKNFGLTKDDLNAGFDAGNELGIGNQKLSAIVAHLEETYCRSIGVEYVFIRQPEIVDWLQKRMETSRNIPKFEPDEKKEIFEHLKRAVGFEQFIHKKFIGQKRFSLEGAETLIPALDFLVERGADMGIENFVIGMPHRGRLNVLANSIQKPYEDIFNEYLGESYDDNISLGDVKYHLGYNQEIVTPNGKHVQLDLAPNPSHLEMVGAVVEGITRGKIDSDFGGDFSKVVPIIIHGDAAIAAQGIVYEIIQMSQLDGYKTGGTVHLVINNQVGFTTNYLEGRSSTYCTDVAKITRSPVFHVNGDDVEALIYTVTLALEYRQKFRSDVFIDILCYRRYGHNEGDEPRFTQPTLYKAIAKHPNPRDIYAQKLIEQDIYKAEEIKQLQSDFNNLLEEKFSVAKSMKAVHIAQFLGNKWNDYHYPEDADFRTSPPTGVDEAVLRELALKINTLPENKSFFKKILKLHDDRKKMVENNKLDWAMGELLAYATLLAEGHNIRLSGQDSERGTFSHRHASLRVEDSEEKFVPLTKVTKDTRFRVYNSLLSEYGVLGFDYGYALATPNDLTIWEAQFGDFHNVAQAIIDQYISSAEEKWGLMNGLTLFLPHGYEGQGPEHSSARIERFLNMAANNNIQVVNPTTPANMFHLLRRQLKRNFRVPLVIFTPKSLLRHPACTSALAELSQGTFQEVIDDQDTDVENVRRVVFCSGKVYYDLLAKKQEYNARDVALIRVEQLHPFPKKQLKQIVKKYKNNMLSLWVQEEPENMGAWQYIRENFTGTDLELVGRLPSGSPAVGLNKLHVKGQEEIIYKVFRKCDCELNNVYCGLQCVVGKSRTEILKQHRYLLDKEK